MDRNITTFRQLYYACKEENKKIYEIALDNEASNGEYTEYRVRLQAKKSLDAMKEAVKEISCWGDSMMEGCGKGFAVINNNGLYKDISNYDSPFTVEELTRYNTYNFGVAGETSYEIALRAGGIGIYTDRNLHLTSYTTERAKLKDDYGNVVKMNDFSGYGWENNDYPNADVL